MFFSPRILTCLALCNASAKAGLLAELAAGLAEDPGGKSLILHSKQSWSKIRAKIKQDLR